MTSVALGIFIVFIVYVMIWSIKNDGARSIGDQSGIIKMRDPSDTAGKPYQRSGRQQYAGQSRAYKSSRLNPTERS
jgi:hypothetical protein